MKKKILNIVLAAAVTPFLCCCTDNFEEYNTNPYEPHSLNPPMLFATMITTGINVQQNDNQMIDQMVARMVGIWCDFGKWFKHERALCHLHMRHLQRVFHDHFLIIEQNVNVQSSWAPVDQPLSAGTLFNIVDNSQQILWRIDCLNLQTTI